MDEFSSESSLDLPNLDQALIDVATLDRLQTSRQYPRPSWSSTTQGV